MPKRAKHLTEEYERYQAELARAIGARIRARRIELGLSQAQLRARLEQERVPVSRTHYSRLERGECLPNAAVLLALGKALGVGVAGIIK